MRRILSGAWLGCISLTAAPAWGTSLEQRVGGYTDSQGLTRQRVAYDASIDGKPAVANLTSTNVDVAVTHDQYQRSEMDGDDYDKAVYGSSSRVNDAVSATATQTWDRLTDTRVVGSYATDREVRSRTWGAGASTWFHEESLRLSFDLSRTVLEQPLYQILDLDFQEAANPTIASSTGATIALRHLATPTTIVDYTVSHIATENRPDSNSGAIAVRQFVPALDGAVHVSATRAYNRGYITTATNYGQVDAWLGETAWLQNLWRGARSRLAYRFYKEDETTRAYGDEKVFGSDTVSLSFAQDLPRRAIDSLGVPLTIEASAARYLTNVGIAAAAFEGGVTAKF